MDSVVLETFQGVDKGCEHADIFAIWILDSGVYRMHNPAKALADSAFVTFAHWGRSLDSGFGFCDLHDRDHAQSRKMAAFSILYSVLEMFTTSPWGRSLDSGFGFCDLQDDGLAPTHGHQPCRCCTALSICPVVDSDSLPCPPGTRRVSRGSIAEFLSFLLGGRSHVLPAGVHHAMRRTSAAKLASASGSGLCCLTEKS